LTGIYGNPLFNDPFDQSLLERLQTLKITARAMNYYWADKLGIERSVSITTVKPSGTVSQLTGVSSGIHPWFADRYIRTVRGGNQDPLTQLMIDAGVPHEPDVMNPDKTTVFMFPIEAPSGAKTQAEVSALEHLALYRVYRKFWSDHQVSITVTVKPDEWVSVAAWVYENWDIVAGVSFLPSVDHVYQQAPYQAADAGQIEALRWASPERVRFEDLVFYETHDGTVGGRELACAADGSCEVVDLV